MNTLKTAIIKHLKNIGDKTNVYDVAKHLNELDLTNSRISGHQQFIKVVEEQVADHSAASDVSGPTLKKNKRAGAIKSNMMELYKINQWPILYIYAAIFIYMLLNMIEHM